MPQMTPLMWMMMLISFILFLSFINMNNTFLNPHFNKFFNNKLLRFNKFTSPSLLNSLMMMPSRKNMLLSEPTTTLNFFKSMSSSSNNTLINELLTLQELFVGELLTQIREKQTMPFNEDLIKQFLLSPKLLNQPLLHFLNQIVDPKLLKQMLLNKKLIEELKSQEDSHS